MYTVPPAHVAANDAGNNAGDVDGAVLKDIELLAALDGMGSENIVPSGKMGLGQPPDPESKPLRLRISWFGSKVLRPRFVLRPSSIDVRWHPPRLQFRDGITRSA